MRHWDTDGDYVPDGAQHNTYDIEFYGPNPLTGAFLLGALKAAGEGITVSACGKTQIIGS